VQRVGWERFSSSYPNPQRNYPDTRKSFIPTKYRQQDIPLQGINHEFLRDFEHYLKTVRDCGHNTTVKYILILRKIIRVALDNDRLKNDPMCLLEQELLPFGINQKKMHISMKLLICVISKI
jgi:hypothetical protein